MSLVSEFVYEGTSPTGGQEPADSKGAASLAKAALANKAAVALQFRQLWRHKYVKGNFDSDKAWKLFYWPLTHSGAGGDGYNPNTRQAAAKIMVSAFNKWAKADMKAKVKRADGEKELPVGQISRDEFVKWFTGGGARTSEALIDEFVHEAKKEKAPKERDIQKEMERVEKEGYSLKDVQAYYDMQIAQSLDQGTAINRTKEQFKLKNVTVSPAGVVLAPEAPNPKPSPSQQFVKEPPPEEPPPKEPPPEEPPPKAPPQKSGSTMKGGTMPEGPKGAAAAPGPK